jgi:predicted amino acid dehydrogenase
VTTSARRYTADPAYTSATAVPAVRAIEVSSCHTGTSPPDHRIGIAIGALSGNIETAVPQALDGSPMTTTTLRR